MIVRALAAVSMAVSTRPRRAGGVRVNPTLPLPEAPGPWVDETTNHVTGGRYRDYRSTCDFGRAGHMIRKASEAQGIPGGGYRSRGPILHAMRVCKLGEWYEDALDDGYFWHHEAGRPFTADELRERDLADLAELGLDDDPSPDGLPGWEDDTWDDPMFDANDTYEPDPEFGF